MKYGEKYGYTFEHEATYDRMCLVNNAVYIAKYATAEKCQLAYGYVPGDIRKHPGEWNATGTQFQIPYVFKKLFSREEIVFEDMCETKSVTTALYLDTNETLPDVSEYEKELETLRKKWPDKEGQSVSYTHLMCIRDRLYAETCVTDQQHRIFRIAAETVRGFLDEIEKLER